MLCFKWACYIRGNKGLPCNSLYVTELNLLILRVLLKGNKIFYYPTNYMKFDSDRNKKSIFLISCKCLLRNKNSNLISNYSLYRLSLTIIMNCTFYTELK